MNKRIVYIAHPIGGNIEENLADLIRILRIINLDIHPRRFKDSVVFGFTNVVPLAPYYADILALDDNVIEERKRGIENDTELINRKIFDELWLTGNNISHGMHCELELFRKLELPVLNYIGRI